MGVVVVVVPGVLFPKGSSSSVPRVSSPKRSSYLPFRPHPWRLGGVSVLECFRFCSSLLSRGFVPQEKLGRTMLPRSQAGCSLGFRPPREAGAASMLPHSPAGEGILFVPGFRPPGESLRRSSGFRPPREAGATSILPRSPAGEGLLFVPGVSSPKGSSSSFLRFSSPKGSWGGVDAALAIGCRTAAARRWAIRLFVADNAVRPMKAADAAPGLYTLLPERRRRADVSDLY